MTTAVFALARTLHLGSAMLLVALPYFLLVVLKSTDNTVSVYHSFYARVVRWLWIVLAVETVSGIAWFWFVAAQMSDQSPWQLLARADFGAALRQTQFGQLWTGRTVVGVAVGTALCLVSRENLARHRFPFRSYQWILVLSTGLLVTLAWAGHAASGIHFHSLHLVADTLHLLIGAVLPMGLIPMGGFLWHLHKDRQYLLSESDIAILRRFSTASLFAVLALVVTGVINGWLMIGSWYALATTAYGQLLIVKIAVVGLMIVLGGFNRFQLLSRMHVETKSARTVRRIIFAESALAAVVLLIVGTMGMTHLLHEDSTLKTRR